MQKKKVQAIAVVGEALAEWLKHLESGGTFRIAIPPKRLNRREMAVIRERMKVCDIYPADSPIRLLKAIENSKCSH